MSDDKLFNAETFARIEGELTIDMITRLVQEQQIKSCSIIVHGEDEVFIVDEEGKVEVKHWDEIRRAAMRKRPAMIAAHIDAGSLHFPLPPDPPPCISFDIPAPPRCEEIHKITDLVLRIETATLKSDNRKREKVEKKKHAKPVHNQPKQRYSKPQFRNTNMRGRR